MPLRSICPQCGRELPDAVMEGICPRCVGRVVFLLDSRSSLAHRPGERVRYFGDYELTEEIARGGMGVVWRARQVSLNRAVALKMILAGQLATPAEVARFRHGAQAAARLDHPNIVGIYEVGEHEGQHYFAMRLVEGPSLATPGNPVERVAPAATARLVAKVARAVHHAHQRGILHRDLKPANILVDDRGEPHVTDFGLAKQVDHPADLTRSEALLGTPHYMSPEQALGRRDLTTGTDIYSLGAVLYFLLTRQPPFPGPTAWEVLRAVVEKPPTPPSTVTPTVSGELETICLKCLEKDPERRYRSAEGLAEDLERWLRHEPILARPVTRSERLRKWIRRRPAVAALAATSMFLLVALLIGSGIYAMHLSTVRDYLEDNLYVAETAMAFAAWEHGSVTLPRRLLDLQRPQSGRPDRRGFEWHYLDALCRSQEQFSFPKASSPIFGLASSPGGRLVACGHNDGRIRLLDLVEPREVGAFGSPGWVFSVAFTADGQRLVTSTPTRGFDVWDVGRQTLVTNLVGHSPDHEALGVACSPDGNLIATTAVQGLYERTLPGSIFLWDAHTFEFRFRLEGHTSNPWKPAFSPDSRLLATPHADGSIVLWDLASRERRRIFRRHGDIVSCVRFSPDGQWLASASLDETVRLWHVAGDEHIPLGAHRRPADCVAFSPDGRWLASGSRDHTIKLWDLWHLTNRPVTLRGHTGRIWSVDFTADSRRLVSGSLDATVKLWEVSRPHDPTSESAQVTSLGTVFSPDNRLNVRADGTQLTVREVPSERVVATLPARNAAFSPRGPIATVSGAQGFTVWDSRSFQRMADVPSDAVLDGPVWFSPDGEWLALARGTGSSGGETPRPRGGGSDGQAAPSRRYGTWSQEWRLFSAVEIRETARWQPHGTWTLDPAFRLLSFSPDSRYLAASCRDGSVRLVEVRSLRPVRASSLTHLQAYRLAWVPDSHILCIGGFDGLVHLWDLETDRAEILTPEAGNVWALAVSPDARTLAVGTQDGMLKLFNLGTRREIANLRGHLTWIGEVAFSPDGQCLISTGGDASRIWRAAAPGPAR